MAHVPLESYKSLSCSALQMKIQEGGSPRLVQAADG